MESLKEKYRDYFEVGTAVNAKTVISHGDLIRKHFSSVTCENEMKYASVTAGKDFYDFNAADIIAEFAAANNLAMRGHTFVWHNQTPRWVFEDTDKAGLLKRIRNHMAMLGGRYKEQISCWDVVNEAVEDKQEMFLRQSKWLEILGEGYMDEVFMAAREILPDCKLFYNDYNETYPDKRSKIFRIVKGMKDRGVPIDGIGMQCHWNIHGPSLEEVRKTIEMYASLGVRLHITELDISLFEFNDRSRLDKPSGDILEKQAVVFDNYFKLFREYREVIDSVTLWGAADDSTWLDNFPERGRKNWPLLFDEDHNPKEAFYRIMNF